MTLEITYSMLLFQNEETTHPTANFMGALTPYLQDAQVLIAYLSAFCN